MAEVTAIRSVVPVLDPYNAGANAAVGEGDEVGYLTNVGVCAVRAAESKGDGVDGVPQLEPREMDAVEGKGGVKGVRASQKRTMTEDLLMSPSKEVVTKLN